MPATPGWRLRLQSTAMANPGTRGLCAVVLAAGAGTRLRPLTELLPKALCPVGNVPLVDRVVARARRVTADVAVNVHHHRDLLVAHLDGRVHVSVEEPVALGTAGAIGALRNWIDGRDVLVCNADSVAFAPLDALVDGWDGMRPRLLVTPEPRRADFRGLWRFAGASLLPGVIANALEPRPSGLYEMCWRERESAGELELVPATSAVIDCGTPADYLAANLVVSGGRSVVGAGAGVEGQLVESVVWPGAQVAAGERLVRAIRLPDGRTIQPV